MVEEGEGNGRYAIGEASHVIVRRSIAAGLFLDIEKLTFVGNCTRWNNSTVSSQLFACIKLNL
jgi:hypothetical protein